MKHCVSRCFHNIPQSCHGILRCVSSAAPIPPASELEALLARLAALESRARARDERIELLEEENRWLKAQLFGRSSEKSAAEEINPEQAWLFNEAEALARAAESAPQSITIPPA